MDWFKTNVNSLAGKVSNMTTTDGIQIVNNRREIEQDFLRKVNYSDIDFFHLNGYETWAKCVKQYDGDTVTVVFFLNGKPFKFRIRLAGIDTAEKTAADPYEVSHAIRASEMLKTLISDDLIWVKCYRWDKYGRLLADLYFGPEGGFSFSEVLVSKSLAYPYKGGKRRKFREWADRKYWSDMVDEGESKPVDNVNDSEVIAHPLNEEPNTDFQEVSNVSAPTPSLANVLERDGPNDSVSAIMRERMKQLNSGS